MLCNMAVRLSGLALALSAVLAGGARAEDRSAVFDAAALVGAGQAESLTDLAAARLTRIRALRPEASQLPTIDRGGPSGAFLTGPSLFDMVARVGDLPIYSGGYHDFGVWSHGFGRQRGIGSSADAIGFSSTLAGGALGVDWEIGEHWVLGGMVAASAGRLEWNDDSGDGSAAGGAGALYLSYFDRDMFLDASLAAGLIRSDASVDSAGLRFDRADATLGLRVDAGFDIGFAGLQLRPTVSTSMLAVGCLNEGGLSAVAEDVQMRQFDTRFGLSIGRTFTVADMALEATGNLSWERGFTINGAVADGAARPAAARLSHGALTPRFGVSLKLDEDWVVFARYDGSFSGGTPRHTVTSGMRAAF